MLPTHLQLNTLQSFFKLHFHRHQRRGRTAAKIPSLAFRSIRFVKVLLTSRNERRVGFPRGTTCSYSLDPKPEKEAEKLVGSIYGCFRERTIDFRSTPGPTSGSSRSGSYSKKFSKNWELGDFCCTLFRVASLADPFTHTNVTSVASDRLNKVGPR